MLTTITQYNCEQYEGMSTESRREKSDTAPVQCKWTACTRYDIPFDHPDDLARHVEKCHMTPCAGMDLFFCLWEGCKVYNKASYSFGWLQRHVKEKHTKERPNKCIMNGCNKSFNTAEALQRHILLHFERTPSPPVSKPIPRGSGKTPSSITPSGAGASRDEDSDTNSDSRRPNGIRYRQRRCSLKVRIPRQSLILSAPYPQASFHSAHPPAEVLDPKTMSVIRQTTNQLAVNDIDHRSEVCITATAQIVGKRKRPCLEEEELLVRWNPRLVADTWVRVSEYKERQAVPLRSLSDKQLSLLSLNCFGHDKLQHRKSKRKP